MTAIYDIQDIYKSPAEISFLSLLWATELNEQTIASSAWVMGEELESSEPSNTSDTTTTKISGGEMGEVYRIKNVITTSAGETLEQSVDVHIIEK